MADNKKTPSELKHQSHGSWSRATSATTPRQIKREMKNATKTLIERRKQMSGKKGPCFITTAVCKTLNKPDDCAELTKFRCFRDTFMQSSLEMRAEIEEYYVIAPQICDAIDRTGEMLSAEKYTAIWETYLKKAFESLDADDKQTAHDIYKEMVLSLKEEYAIV